MLPRVTLLHAMLFVFLTGAAGGIWFSYAHTELFVPKYLSERPSSGITGCCGNLTRIGLAVEAYYREHGELPQSQYDLVPHYLPEIPRCPSADYDTYRSSFGGSGGRAPWNREDYYLVECCGENHKDYWVAPDFPAYDNQNGLKLVYTW